MYSKFSRIGAHSAINAFKQNKKPKDKRNTCCPVFTEVENDVFPAQGYGKDAGDLGVHTRPLPPEFPPGKETHQKPEQQTEAG